MHVFIRMYHFVCCGVDPETNQSNELFTDCGSGVGMLIQCTWCQTIDQLQYEDWVTKPMLWCEGCGARCVMDLGLDHGSIIFGDLQPSIDPSIKDRFKPHIVEERGGDIRCYRVPCLYILQVKNDRLAPFQAPVPVSQEDMNRFIESDYDPSIAEELGITEKADYNQERQTGFDWCVSVFCKSFNAEEPTIPYPENFCLDHDGRYVHLMLVDGAYSCKERLSSKVDILYESYWEA